MDILIKNLGLPKTENDNFMVIVTPTGVIDVVENGNGFMMQKKYEAIELPPHGRLGDLDALIEHETYNIEQALFDTDEVLEDLKNTPVIVEANYGTDN